MATPAEQTPAQRPQALRNLGSSPVKPEKNVASQDRKEVGDNLKYYPISVEGFSQLIRQEAGDKDPNIADVADNDFVGYLNHLSNTVHERDRESDYIYFLDYGDKLLRGHPTKTKCRPDFVAIRTAESMVPIGVTLPDTPTVDPLPGEDTDSPAEDTNSPAEDTDSPPPPEPTLSPPIDLVWSQLEATGEIRSKGSTALGAISQTGSYTVFLLQARPDLVSVTGIFVNPEKSTFRLFFMDAWRHCYTPSVPFDDPKAQGLLMAWIRRLYNPETSTLIKRVHIFPDKPTFTITRGDSETFKDCTLLVVGSLRRRATIFGVGTEDEPLIIKTQYHDEERRFEESQILGEIHEKGYFPGVVRVLEGGKADVSPVGAPSGNAVLDNHRSSGTTMVQTVLVLKDKAGPLMNATTPLEALIAIYDLLEVTRFLHTTRKILHRDISEGNVLLRDKDQNPQKLSGDDFKDMCFATHLLGKQRPDGEEADRLYTRVVLIDFHQAEGTVSNPTGRLKDRSGTPRFMARLVRIPKVTADTHYLPPMPQLDGPAEARYKACVPNRIPDNPEETLSISRIMYEVVKEQTSEAFTHMLSYDAESILWLLLYWAIQAHPVTKERDQIDANLWANLTGGDFKNDTRRNLVRSSGTGWNELCHPVYRPLDELLNSLFGQLLGYQEYVLRPKEAQVYISGLWDRETRSTLRWNPPEYKQVNYLPAPADPRMEDYYLHEVFQRAIFGFIVANREKEFMNREISPKRRQPVKMAGMSQAPRGTGMWTDTCGTAGTKRKTMEQEGMVGGEAPNKKSKSVERNTRSTALKSTSTTQPAKEKGMVAREGRTPA